MTDREKIDRALTGEFVGNVAPLLASELARVYAELEQTADRLSDCWLLLDAIARDQSTPILIRQRATAILRRQECPGWKS